MARKLSLNKGRDEIEHIMEKYPRKMRDKKVKAVIDNILWAVAAQEGPEVANSLITQYELDRPANGSHEWFHDDVEKNPVVHLHKNYEFTSDDRIMPGDKRHPGAISVKDLRLKNKFKK